MALLCLLSSASLGLMVHDGAVGDDHLASAKPGDDVRFRASVEDASSMAQFLNTWSFHAATVDLLQLDDGYLAVVLHDGEPLDDGSWVVEGVVKGHMIHTGKPIAIVQATAVNAPILFA